MLNKTEFVNHQVQFGCTRFADVNPEVHAYARGKGKHLAAAVDLLRHFAREVWAFEEQDQEPMPARELDRWQVLDLRQYKCPSSKQLWFGCDDESVWFMPDDSGALSTCGEWQAYQDEVSAVWWCNERRGHVFFPTAA